MLRRSIGLVFIVLSKVISAQEVEIYLFGEEVNVSGTTVELLNADMEMHQEFDVKNVSEIDGVLRVTRVKVDEMDGVEDRICWGTSDSSATCYPYFSVAPNASYTTAVTANVEAGGKGWLSVFYSPNGISGCAQYRYYVINEANTRLDSVDVRFCSTVGFLEQEFGYVSAYPNPVQTVLTIENYRIDDDLEVQILNSNRQLVFASELEYGFNRVDFNRFQFGVYFYVILKDGIVVEADEFIKMN